MVGQTFHDVDDTHLAGCRGDVGHQDADCQPAGHRKADTPGPGERFEVLGGVSYAEGKKGGFGEQAQGDDGESRERAAENSHQDQGQQRVGMR